MTHRIRIAPLLLALIVVATSVVVLSTRDEATAGQMNNPNSIWYWCGEDGGKKEVAPDNPFVLPVPRHGTVVLLVLKSGTGDDAYTQIPFPTPGESYEHSSGGDISFAIWCKGDEPDPTTTTTVAPGPVFVPTARSGSLARLAE